MVMLLPIALAACAGGDDGGSISYISDRGGINQPIPTDYRPQLLAFMKTYLNDPVGVHDAMMAEPVERPIGGQQRSVSCLRYTPRESNGSYGQLRERAIVFVDGRLDHVVENADEICAGVSYAPFPALEKMTR
jgi:hypothetical protein